MSKEPEPRQNKRRGLVDRNLVEAPSNFIAGRPKAALLFWFFGHFRCDVPFFVVILVIFKYNKRPQAKCPPTCEMSVCGEYVYNMC